MTCASQRPCSGISWCIRRRSSSLTALSLARMRSRRDFPPKLELALARPPADENEAQDLEGFRLAEPALRSSSRRKAAKLDQAGLFRMQRQRELLQPFTHRVPEAPGVTFMLETDDEIVSISHDDHVTRGLVPSPAFSPEV